MKILNCTQHVASKDQIDAGVYEPKDDVKKQIQTYLTFDSMPSHDEMLKRAEAICNIVSAWAIDMDFVECEVGVMIGGAPFFMSLLEHTLRNFGYIPMYAFSKRVVEEEHQADGSVVKTNVFRFEGFIIPD